MRFLDSRTLRSFRERTRELAGRDAPEHGASSGGSGEDRRNGSRPHKVRRGRRFRGADPATPAAEREAAGNVWKMKDSRRRELCGRDGPGMADAEGRRE